MTENIPLFKANGEFNGSLPLGGKKRIPTADLNRKLRLGYPIKPAEDVENYLALRSKWDSLHAKRVYVTDLEQNRKMQKEAIEALDQAGSYPREVIDAAWEFTSFHREQAGEVAEEIPYDESIKAALARFNEDGVVNQESIEAFLPPRMRFLSLGSGRECFDMVYEDYVRDQAMIPKSIIIGAHVDYIGFNIKAKDQRAYVPFKEAIASLGLKDVATEDEGEATTFAEANLASLEARIQQYHLVKIRALRLTSPIPEPEKTPETK